MFLFCFFYFQNALLHKFSDPMLRQALVSTRHAFLIEAVPGSRFWGCGYSYTDDRCQRIASQYTRNMLGDLLMQLRAKIVLGLV